MMDTDALRLLSLSLTSRNDIKGYSYEMEDSFALSDLKTCSSPRKVNLCPSVCNEDILKIDTDRPLTIVRYDDWMSDESQKKCDYLLFDSGNDKQKFAFCELTCSQKKYVDEDDSTIKKEGKRAKAFNQMQETWSLIKESDNPVFQTYILRFREKCGIFGWREKTLSGDNEVNDGPKLSMRKFLRTPGSGSGITEYSQHEFGEHFKFIQVKYPSHYIW